MFSSPPLLLRSVLLLGGDDVCPVVFSSSLFIGVEFSAGMQSNDEDHAGGPLKNQEMASEKVGRHRQEVCQINTIVDQKLLRTHHQISDVSAKATKKGPPRRP